MTAPVVVGYTATDTGADALALGIRLARAIQAPLEVVLVLPDDARSVITPPDASYARLVREQAERWLGDAATVIRDAVPHREHLRHGDSFAEGLVAFADEIGAGYIVVGAANGGLRGRHRLGTVASELLHSSDVPVVLAPEGSRRVDPAVGISRITAAIGSRPGADVLREESVALAAAASVPLRLLSLITVDLPPGLQTGAIRIAGAAHAEDVLSQAQSALPADIAAEVLVADGEDIEEAVRDLPWDPAELVMVGSSRLAQPRRLFLGSTAAKMLHELPVPLVVVPRSRADVSSSEGTRP
ncbi:MULTISPECIES: universal stress protein [unclassified Microbacterium]|uniref:universal stress protein n=1 Tax=unclassified Microbacterium TaxID=2609290 RepID=UPI001E0C6BDE|nr:MULTISPECIES: universal stress protein [unclassified Microbacterium]MBT9607389.1 universal stress protein [Microbacterium sp.]CAH0188485.1 Universal stress protein Rv2319c [Microbacterium sp. Bi128]